MFPRGIVERVGSIAVIAALLQCLFVAERERR